jgi:HEPN domain-containing protein
MLLDAQRVTETRKWFQKAISDYRGALTLSSITAPQLDLAVYHCQQAAEKALKAILFWNDIPFRKTHDLEELISLMREN